MFVPNDFKVPELKTEKYLARKLCARDVYLDYFAVMSSIDIKSWVTNSWPMKKVKYTNKVLPEGFDTW